MFGLFLEAAAIERIRAQVDRKPLEGDAALQARVFRPVHFSHASFTQPLANHKSGLWCPRSEVRTPGCPRFAIGVLSWGS